MQPEGPSLFMLTPYGQAMAAGNLGLIGYICRRHKHRGLEWDEMFAAGSVGLIHAVARYNPNRGVKFSTHAYWWIERSVRDAIGRNRIVPVPKWRDKGSGTIDQFRKLRAAKTRRLDGNGFVAKSGSKAVRFDPPDPGSLVRHRDSDDAVIFHDVLTRFPARDRTVMQMRAEGKTYKEIAAYLGMTRQGAMNLECKVRARVRARCLA